MYFVYILYSESIDQFYVGQTKDLDDRIARHNQAKSLSTKRGVPWRLEKVIGFESKKQCLQAERWLKKMKSRRILIQVIEETIDLKTVIG